MRSLLTLAAAAAITGFLGFGAAQATPAGHSPAPAIAVQDLLQPVHYPYYRCRAWRRECAARWGWGGWRYARCMRRHGC